MPYYLRWKRLAKLGKFLAAPTAVGVGLTAAEIAGSFALDRVSKSLKRKRDTMERGRSRSRSAGAVAGTSARAMSRSRSRSESRARRYPRSAGPGHYTGRLRSPTRPKGPSKYDKIGYSKEVERHGVQSLNDVCYLGASSLCHQDLGPVVGVALIRKLMKRHYQFEYTHPNQYINPAVGAPNTVAGSGPQGILFYYEETTQNAVEPTIGIGWQYSFYDPANPGAGQRTLNDFGSSFHLNVLTSETFGASIGPLDQYPIRRLHGYQFIESDYTVQAYDPNGNTVTRHTTLFPLKNQYLTVYQSVKMGIQNITPADDATGAVLETTRIDANPIKGKLMKFSNNLPLLRQRRGAFGSAPPADEAYRLQVDPNGDGVIKPATSLLGDWTQVPTAMMFENCIGEAPVRLEPGEIKDYSFVFKFNGTLEKFMRGFGAFLWPIMQKKVGFGQSIMFCLEKRMPTGAAPVRINFHYESRMGAVFGKRLGALMQRTGVAGAAVEGA